MTNQNKELQEEARAFDHQASSRTEKGFIPDLRNLQTVDWFYNNVWREPEFTQIKLMPVFESIIEQAKKNGTKVLEIGCGYGFLSLEMARYGLNVTGIDLSPKSIGIAKEYLKKNTILEQFGSLDYRCGDFSSIDLVKNSFDSVVMFGALHHFPDVDIVIKKIDDILSSRGELLIYEPIRENFSRTSAEFALMLRTILPTWESFDKKLDKEWNEETWYEQVDQIYEEYVYEGDHHQSIMDNSTNSDESMLKAIEPYFEITHLEYHDAFLDKLIGGLRGEHRFQLARFLYFFDKHVVKQKILPPTSMTLFAKKP